MLAKFDFPAFTNLSRLESYKMQHCFGIVFNLLIACACASVHKFPLRKSDHAIASYLMRQRSTHGQTVLTTEVLPSEGHKVPFYNYLNGQYLAEISLGTPAQAFNVVIDTALSDFWIPSSRCRLLACFEHNHYNSSASSSYKANGSDFSIGNEVRGLVSQDTLQIGDLQVKNVTFGEAVWLQERFFLHSPFDGILGLAPEQTGDSGIRPPLREIVQDEALDEPIFAFHFGNSSLDNDDSELVLGGSDKVHYSGEVVRLPNRQDGVWEVELSALRFGKHEIELEDTDALFRTGFSMVSLPFNVAELLHVKMGAKPTLVGLYTIHCSMRDTLPDLAFVLAGHYFALSAYEYTFEHKGTCISLILGVDFEQPRIQLGLPFFLPWYSIYNITDGTVGLARAVH